MALRKKSERRTYERGMSNHQIPEITKSPTIKQNVRHDLKATLLILVKKNQGFYTMKHASRAAALMESRSTMMVTLGALCVKPIRTAQEPLTMCWRYQPCYPGPRSR